MEIKFGAKLRNIAFEDEWRLRMGAVMILADAVMSPAGRVRARILGEIARF